MDDILDNIDFDIENNRTVFLKESDPFLPIIPSPEIQEELLEERLRTPPATPIHSPHAFLKEDRRLFSPPPVLTSEHAKLDNSEIGLNLTDNTDKRRKSPALRKRAARPKSLVLSSEENFPRKRVRPSTASTPPPSTSTFREPQNPPLLLRIKTLVFPPFYWLDQSLFLLGQNLLFGTHHPYCRLCPTQHLTW